MKIAVDFDGTIVDHRYPDIGAPVPGALEWLKRFADAGADIILYTMRSDGNDGPTLTQAVEFIRSNGIALHGVNTDPDQSRWTSSPKCYAHVYIDDAALGCPLKNNPRMGGRPYVDWDIVGPAVMQRLKHAVTGGGK